MAVAQYATSDWPNTWRATYCSAFQPKSNNAIRFTGKFAKISANPIPRRHSSAPRSRNSPRRSDGAMAQEVRDKEHASMPMGHRRGDAGLQAKRGDRRKCQLSHDVPYNSWISSEAARASSPKRMARSVPLSDATPSSS